MNGRRRLPLILGLLAALLAAICLLSMFAGAVWVGPGELLASSILRLRAARIVLAVAAGAGLSVAGVVFQAILRNPLAEPYLLGVSSGAGLGAALAIVSGLASLADWALPGAAFAGALGSLVLVCVVAQASGAAHQVQTLLLAGVVVSAVLGSVLMFLVSTASNENLHGVVWWLLGNLQVFNVRLLQIVSAAHLGLSPSHSRRWLLLLASLMAGATVAACGLIGFVGLMVPHAIRRFTGPDHRRLVPASALAGAAFLVAADSVARTATAPVEIPIGVVTALLGGPFFLFLLMRRKAADSI
jgi:iron complex transport system permease protein